MAVEGYLVCPEKLAGGLRVGGRVDKVDSGQVPQHYNYNYKYK